MKILITTDWYMPMINGVVISVANLATGLETMGHEVRILTLARGRRSYKKGNVIYMGSAKAGKIYPNARMKIAPAHRYIKELMEWAPDIVHSQCEFNTFPSAYRVARHCGIPLIHTYHTAYEDYTHYFSPSVRVGRYLVSVFSKQIMARVDGVIAPTSKAYEILQRYGVDCPMAVIPSGIDLEQFLRPMSAEERAHRRAKLGISDTDKVILYLGRLAKEKNIEELFAFLQGGEDKSVRLLLVGDGPYRENLVNIAYNMGITDRVIFAGAVPPEQVANYYKTADIFASASQSETQGLTYIEAMASGLPILCKDDSCLDGIVESGYNGFTYISQTDFKTHARRLLCDDTLKRSIGETAQKTMQKRFSKESFSQAVSAFYEEVWEM